MRSYLAEDAYETVFVGIISALLLSIHVVDGISVEDYVSTFGQKSGVLILEGFGKVNGISFSPTVPIRKKIPCR